MLEDARRSTTSRPTSCWPAATRSACSSSTAGRCASLLRLDAADVVRGHLRASSRSTGPARWAPTRTTTTPTARTAASRSCRSTPSWPSRWPRSSARPTALIVYQEQVMAIAQKVAGYSLGTSRPAAPRDGQEEEGDPRQGVRPVLRRACRSSGYSDGAIKTLWDILVPFSDYAFNKRAHRRLRAGRPTGRRTSRPTTRPSTWRRCSPRSRTTRTSPRSTSHECRRMGIKVLPPDVNDSDADFTPRGTDIRFGLSAIRNVGDERRRLDRRDPRGEGRASPTSPTSCARSSRSPATRRSSSR